MLEIAGHLVDEEREDFRTRVRVTLETPGTLPPPIDPEGWVKTRNYAGQDYVSKVSEWRKEREASVVWLRSLDTPDWSSSFTHRQFGLLSAGMFLANWLAHDQLHMLQIMRQRYFYFAEIGGEDLRYAGDGPAMS